jgi:hypothetical protein
VTREIREEAELRKMRGEEEEKEEEEEEEEEEKNRGRHQREAQGCAKFKQHRVSHSVLLLPGFGHN